MKKVVTVLCMYHDKQIYNITFINRAGDAITMYDSKSDILRPVYQSLTHMYNAILILARNNGYVIPYRNEFGAKWYNIQWCDTAKPNRLDRFAYYGKYGTF